MIGSGVVAFVFGAVVGSFANVCIHRLPRGESIVQPPSHCPACREPIRRSDNIPLIGYVRLRGRCRHCGVRISPRYVLVEAVTAGLFVLLWWHSGGSPATFVPLALLAAALVVSSGIDLEHRLLPDRITLPLLGAGLLVSLAPGGVSPLSALVAAAGGGGLMLLIGMVGDRVFHQPTMGGGDVKLTAALGAWLGVSLLGVALFAAFVLGAVGGAAYLVLGGKHKSVPFGPFLAAGGLLALVAGRPLLTWYLGFFG